MFFSVDYRVKLSGYGLCIYFILGIKCNKNLIFLHFGDYIFWCSHKEEIEFNVPHNVIKKCYFNHV